jgi:Cellulose binding domain
MRRVSALEAAWVVAAGLVCGQSLGGCEAILGTGSLSDRSRGDGGGRGATATDATGGSAGDAVGASGDDATTKGYDGASADEVPPPSDSADAALEATPLASCTTCLTVDYFASDPPPDRSSELFHVAISNDGTTPQALSELTLRYWFTAEGATSFTAHMYYAALSSITSSTLAETFVPMSATSTPPATAKADTYMQVSFTAGAGSIPAMGSTNDIEVEFNDSSYQATETEANDYSYTATDTMTNCEGANNVLTCQTTTITLYRNGVLVWGTEPGGDAESDAGAGSGTEGGSGSSSGGNSDSGGPGSVTSCGSLTSRIKCSANQVCCATLPAQTNACSSPSACPATTTLACSTASDCPSSAPICCAKMTLVTDAANDLPPKCTATGLAASCASSCNDSPPANSLSCTYPPSGGTGLVRLCSHDADCTSDTANNGCYNFNGAAVSWCSSSVAGLPGVDQP